MTPASDQGSSVGQEGYRPRSRPGVERIHPGRTSGPFSVRGAREGPGPLVGKVPGLNGAVVSKALLVDAGRLQDTYGSKLDVPTVEEHSRI